MNAIEASHLRKCFGPVTAVDDVSLEVRQGEIFGFLGPNGAGKTTTTRILTGIIPPDGGSATVLGHDIRTAALQAKQGFGVVPETSNAYVDLTAWQNLMLIGECTGFRVPGPHGGHPICSLRSVSSSERTRRSMPIPRE